MTFLAHAGGVPELLFTVVPVLVFVLVFRVARGKSHGDEDGKGQPASGSAERRR